MKLQQAATITNATDGDYARNLVALTTPLSWKGKLRRGGEKENRGFAGGIMVFALEALSQVTERLNQSKGPGCEIDTGASTLPSDQHSVLRP